MSDFASGVGFDFVTLVDRAMKGGCELIHDGVRIVFLPGQVERPVPQFFAEWLFRVDQGKVHTKDGEYVNRFAVRGAPADMAARLGRAALDESPIEIDTDRSEGWDVDSSMSAADRGQTRVVNLKAQRADYANVAAQGGTFGSR